MFTTRIGPKLENAQNLLKFGTFGISNMPISILMSKMLFLSNIYQLPGPNWSQNKKFLEFIEI